MTFGVNLLKLSPSRPPRFGDPPRKALPKLPHFPIICMLPGVPVSLQRVKVLLFQGINSDRPEQRLVLLDSRISLVISFSLFYLFLTDWLVTDISRHLFTKYSPLMRYLLHSLQLQISDKLTFFEQFF